MGNDGMMGMGSSQDSTKSWFSRPEGKFGTIFGWLVIAAAVGAGLMFWGAILPWLIMIVSNTLTLAAGCAVLALLGYMVMDPRMRNLAFYAYKSFSRLVTGAFIELDPIGILKTYVANLQEKLTEMDQSLANLDGNRAKLRNQIAKNTKLRDEALRMAQEAQRQGKSDALTLNARQAERLAKSNTALQDLLSRMDRLAQVLGKMRGASNIMIQDITNEVDVQTKQRASLLAGYTAFSKAKAIMQGGGDEAELYNMTMEKLADDYGMKMGEIEHFMEASKGFLENVDLENGVAKQSALDALDAWEAKSQHILSNAPPTNGVDVHLRVGTPALPTATGNDAFADLFSEADQAAPAPATMHNKQN